MGNKNDLNLFSDEVRESKNTQDKQNQYSKYCDLIYYESSVTPGFLMAMIVYKPEKPGYIVASTTDGT